MSVDCPVSRDIVNVASSRGHLDCLKYLIFMGQQWLNKTCAVTGYNGHLECLKYLVSIEYPWTIHTFTMICEGGHLNCLMWAIENGYLKPDAMMEILERMVKN